MLDCLNFWLCTNCLKSNRSWFKLYGSWSQSYVLYRSTFFSLGAEELGIEFQGLESLEMLEGLGD